MTTSVQSCPVCHTPIAPGTPICLNCGLVFSSSGVAPVEGSPQITPPPMPGQLIGSGRYTLDRVLSKGGMGAIYLAADHAAFDRSVVVKAMLDYFDPAHPDEVQQARARFLDEARTLAALRHPAIPQIYTFFQDGPHNYIVMEYIEGADLEQGLSATDPTTGATHAGGAYAYEQVLGWGVELCHVLEYLHGRQPPVVHHDIKPANLLRDNNSGELRLVDFGTAKARLLAQPGGKVGVQQSSLYGTKGYAAPEQYRGESEPRSDVYALAATLYHLATDDDPTLHPFDFPKLDGMGALGHALRAALATDPAQRPTAPELRQQLEDLLQPTELHPLEAPDATRLTSAYELASWCEAHWDAAVKWLRGKLPDQIELLWGKSALAARTRGALERFGDDGDAALDVLLRGLLPGFPPPQLTITPFALDFGGIGLARPAQRQLTIRNSGRGYVVLSLRASDWLSAEPSTLRLRPGQSAAVELRAAPLSGSSSAVLSATLDVASQHGALATVQATARLIFQTRDGRGLRDVGELVTWCEAHWFDAGLWLSSEEPGSLPAQIEQVWGDKSLANALREAVRSYGMRDRQIDAALALLDPQGYGARVPQLTITPDTVDFGRLEGAARAQIQVTNAGQRFVHAPVRYPPWLTGGTASLNLAPGDVREIALNVYPNQITLGAPLDGAVELATAGGIAVPVRARAPLMQRIWWRYPWQATLVLLLLLVLLIASTINITTARTRQYRYELGTAALEFGDWAGARRAFDEVLKDDPNYRDAATLRAESFYRPGAAALQKGDWAGARRELRQIDGYRDADVLIRESYYRPLQMALREEQWDEAAEQVVRLEALDAQYRDLPALTVQNAPLNAAVQRRRWQGNDVTLRAELGDAPFVLSGDGHFVATVKGTTVQVWNADTGRLVRVLAAEESSPIFSLSTVALSSDGALVASGGVFGSSLWLWNVADGSKIELDVARAPAMARVLLLRLSPDGRLLTGDNNGAAALWRVSDGKLLDPLGDERLLTSVAFNIAGDTAALVYSDTVTLWRTSDETTLRTIATGHGKALDAAFSPDGQMVAVKSDDGAIALWRVADGSSLGTLATTGPAKRLEFSANGATLATSDNGTVRLLHASDLGLIKEVDGIAAAFAPDGQTLAVTSKAGVTLLGAADGAVLATLAYDVDPFDPERTSVAYSPDGQTIALLGPGLGLQLWRAADGALLQTLPGGWNEGTLAFTPDGRTLISASQSGPVQLWRARPSDD